MKLKTIISSLALAGFVATLSPASAQGVITDDPGGGSQPGSVVVYPLFQLASQGYTTVIRLVNNHPSKDVNVHLVRVCGGIKGYGAEGFCDASNRQVKLTHNQTKVVNVQNFFGINDGVDSLCATRTGFVVAYAVDPNQANRPISWNWLTGSTYQRRTGVVAFPNATAGAQAIAIQADDDIAEGAPVPGASGGAFPILPFGDEVEDVFADLPTVWKSDFIATTNALAPSSGRRSALALVSLDIKAGFQNAPTVVALDWYNEAEDVFSTSLEYVCHVYKELQDISSSFELGNLGSFYGTLYVTPFRPDDGEVVVDNAIIAQIKELEPNRETLRNMYHDGEEQSATFQSR